MQNQYYKIFNRSLLLSKQNIKTLTDLSLNIIEMANSNITAENINWFRVAKALSLIGLSLEEYTRIKLDGLQQKIYKRLGHLLPCNQQCSHLFGKDFKR